MGNEIRVCRDPGFGTALAEINKRFPDQASWNGALADYQSYLDKQAKIEDDEKRPSDFNIAFNRAVRASSADLDMLLKVLKHGTLPEYTDPITAKKYFSAKHEGFAKLIDKFSVLNLQHLIEKFRIPPTWVYQVQLALAIIRDAGTFEIAAVPISQPALRIRPEHVVTDRLILMRTAVLVCVLAVTTAPLDDDAAYTFDANEAFAPNVNGLNYGLLYRLINHLRARVGIAFELPAENSSDGDDGDSKEPKRFIACPGCGEPVPEKDYRFVTSSALYTRSTSPLSAPIRHMMACQMLHGWTKDTKPLRKASGRTIDDDDDDDKKSSEPLSRAQKKKIKQRLKGTRKISLREVIKELREQNGINEEMAVHALMRSDRTFDKFRYRIRKAGGILVGATKKYILGDEASAFGTFAAGLASAALIVGGGALLALTPAFQWGGKTLRNMPALTQLMTQTSVIAKLAAMIGTFTTYYVVTSLVDTMQFFRLGFGLGLGPIALSVDTPATKAVIPSSVCLTLADAKAAQEKKEAEEKEKAEQKQKSIDEKVAEQQNRWNNIRDVVARTTVDYVRNAAAQNTLDHKKSADRRMKYAAAANAVAEIDEVISTAEGTIRDWEDSNRSYDFELDKALAAIKDLYQKKKTLVDERDALSDEAAVKGEFEAWINQCLGRGSIALIAGLAAWNFGEYMWSFDRVVLNGMLWLVSSYGQTNGTYGKRFYYALRSMSDDSRIPSMTPVDDRSWHLRGYQACRAVVGLVGVLQLSAKGARSASKTEAVLTMLTGLVRMMTSVTYNSFPWAFYMLIKFYGESVRAMWKMLKEYDVLGVFTLLRSVLSSIPGFDLFDTAPTVEEQAAEAEAARRAGHALVERPGTFVGWKTDEDLAAQLSTGLFSTWIRYEFAMMTGSMIVGTAAMALDFFVDTAPVNAISQAGRWRFWFQLLRFVRTTFALNIASAVRLTLSAVLWVEMEYQATVTTELNPGAVLSAAATIMTGLSDALGLNYLRFGAAAHRAAQDIAFRYIAPPFETLGKALAGCIDLFNTAALQDSPEKMRKFLNMGPINKLFEQIKTELETLRASTDPDVVTWLTVRAPDAGKAQMAALQTTHTLVRRLVSSTMEKCMRFVTALQATNHDAAVHAYHMCTGTLWEAMEKATDIQFSLPDTGFLHAYMIMGSSGASEGHSFKFWEPNSGGQPVFDRLQGATATKAAKLNEDVLYVRDQIASQFRTECPYILKDMAPVGYHLSQPVQAVCDAVSDLWYQKTTDMNAIREGKLPNTAYESFMAAAGMALTLAKRRVYAISRVATDAISGEDNVTLTDFLKGAANKAAGAITITAGAAGQAAMHFYTQPVLPAPLGVNVNLPADLANPAFTGIAGWLDKYGLVFAGSAMLANAAANSYARTTAAKNAALAATRGLLGSLPNPLALWYRTALKIDATDTAGAANDVDAPA